MLDLNKLFSAYAVFEADKPGIGYKPLTSFDSGFHQVYLLPPMSSDTSCGLRPLRPVYSMELHRRTPEWRATIHVQDRNLVGFLIFKDGNEVKLITQRHGQQAFYKQHTHVLRYWHDTRSWLATYGFDGDSIALIKDFLMSAGLPEKLAKAA